MNEFVISLVFAVSIVLLLIVARLAYKHQQNIRDVQRLQNLYENLDASSNGTIRSTEEWERLTTASTEASRKRRGVQ